MPDDRLVDLAARPYRAWLPRVDDFGRPTEARLYVELVRAAGMRLSVGADGNPRVSFTDVMGESGARVMKVPSPELTAYLDSFRVRRGQTLLDDEIAYRFARLVRARCASPDFVPDSPGGFAGPSPEAAASPGSNEYEEIRDLALQLAEPSTVSAFIRHRARLSSETGLRVLTVPVGVRGRVFVLERASDADPNPERAAAAGIPAELSLDPASVAGASRPKPRVSRTGTVAKKTARRR